METPLKNSKNFKGNNKLKDMKKIFLSLSPMISKKSLLKNNTYKSPNVSNYSFCPGNSFLKNSFLFNSSKKIKKRNSNDTYFSRIHYLNSYEAKESIIYNKKFINKKKNSNILTVVRIRPLIQNEKLISPEIITKVENKNTLILQNSNVYISYNNNKSNNTFTNFNYVFDSNESQKNIFNATVKNLIKDIIKGENISIFAYGGADSGKSYTLFGTNYNPGLIPNTLKEIFKEIKLYKNKEYKIKMSFYKICQNKIIDLLTNEKEYKNENEYINDIHYIEINENNDFFSIISNEDDIYEKSIKIVQIIINYKENKLEKLGKINFIEIENVFFDETKNNLNNQHPQVISNLYEFLTRRNISFPSTNDYNLETILKNIFSLNSKIIFITNISGFIYNYNETLNSLKFAEKIKEMNNESDKKNLNYLENNYLNVIEKLHTKIKSLKNLLKTYDFKKSDIKINRSSSALNYKKAIKPLIVKNEENDFENYHRKGSDLIKANDIIEENNYELDINNINDYCSEKEEQKDDDIIDNFIQQYNAEVKIKQKIMGIYYDIYLLNNSIKEKISKKQSVSFDKKKLKNYKKILIKNMKCLNDISQKNQLTLKKYMNENDIIMLKKDRNIYEKDNDSTNEKNELYKLKIRYIKLIEKICKLQEENIEIKYNYILLQNEISEKDKLIKDLHHEIELRDLNIKEMLSFDNENFINKELDKKYELLLSEQKSQTLRNKNNIWKEFYLNKNEFGIENDINYKLMNYTEKRKHFSFHPRNLSNLKANTISNYLKSKKLGTPIKNFLLPKKLETNTEIRNNINNSNIDTELSLLNLDKNYFSAESNDIIGKEFNEIIKNFNIEDKTEINFGIRNNISKNLNDIINEDEVGEDTNNKTLVSMLNDIQTVNTNINNRLSMIEKKPNNYRTSLIVKPISRTMSNNENIKDIFNNDEEKKVNRIKNITKYGYKYKSSIKPLTDKKKKKKIFKNSKMNLNFISSPNNKDLKLSNKIYNCKTNIIAKKNSNEIVSPNLIISVNLKNKNKKYDINPSLTSTFPRNNINLLKNKKRDSKCSQKYRNKLIKDKIKKDFFNEKSKKSYLNNKQKDNNCAKNKNKIENLINQRTENLKDSKNKENENLKLQIFYSQHLNKFKNNKAKIISKGNNNSDYFRKKEIISYINDSATIFDMKTNYATIDKKPAVNKNN